MAAKLLDDELHEERLRFRLKQHEHGDPFLSCTVSYPSVVKLLSIFPVDGVVYLTYGLFGKYSLIMCP